MGICLIFECPPPEPTFRRPRGHLEQGCEQAPQVPMNPQKPWQKHCSGSPGYQGGNPSLRAWCIGAGAGSPLGRAGSQHRAGPRGHPSCLLLLGHPVGGSSSCSPNSRRLASALMFQQLSAASIPCWVRPPGLCSDCPFCLASSLFLPSNLHPPACSTISMSPPPGSLPRTGSVILLRAPIAPSVYCCPYMIFHLLVCRSLM